MHFHSLLRLSDQELVWECMHSRGTRDIIAVLLGDFPLFAIQDFLTLLISVIV